MRTFGIILGGLFSVWFILLWITAYGARHIDWMGQELRKEIKDHSNYE